MCVCGTDEEDKPHLYTVRPVDAADRKILVTAVSSIIARKERESRVSDGTKKSKRWCMLCFEQETKFGDDDDGSDEEQKDPYVTDLAGLESALDRAEISQGNRSVSIFSHRSPPTFIRTTLLAYV